MKTSRSNEVYLSISHLGIIFVEKQIFAWLGRLLKISRSVMTRVRGTQQYHVKRWAVFDDKIFSLLRILLYTETPSFRTIHIPDRGHFVRLIPAPKFTCSGIFLVRNLHVPKNYCPVNSCIYDKFCLREIFIDSVIFHHSTQDQIWFFDHYN